MNIIFSILLAKKKFTVSLVQLRSMHNQQRLEVN